MYFLIAYDRSKGQLSSAHEYGERELAHDDRLRAELENFRAGRDLEVVVLEAQDRAALLKTHRRYFDSFENLARLLSSAPEFVPQV